VFGELSAKVSIGKKLQGNQAFQSDGTTVEEKKGEEKSFGPELGEPNDCPIQCGTV
jgi:hypothetical protein